MSALDAFVCNGARGIGIVQQVHQPGDVGDRPVLLNDPSSALEDGGQVLFVKLVFDRPLYGLGGQIHIVDIDSQEAFRREIVLRIRTAMVNGHACS